MTHKKLFTILPLLILSFFVAPSAFASILPTKGISGIPGTGSRVPVFDSATEALRQKELGVNVGITGIPGISGIPGTKTSLDSIAWGLADFLIERITDETVRWIENGRKGDPLFVKDWKQFLLDTADEAGGEFLTELGFTDICAPFKPRIQILLGLGRQSFRNRAACTITDVIKNTQNFYQDFSQGGWEQWFQITQIPQNNFHGAYFLALEEKYDRETTAVLAAQNEAQASGGFLSWKTCDARKIPTDETGMTPEEIANIPTVEVCEIQTPGKVVQTELSSVFHAPLERLHVADEIDEIISAVFSTMIKNLRTAQSSKAKKTILDRAKTDSAKGFEDLKQSSITQSGVSEEIVKIQTLVDVENSSIATTEKLTATLNGLSSCEKSKGLATDETDARIETASATITALQDDVKNQTTAKDALTQDLLNMQSAETIDELFEALNTARRNVQAVTGDIPGAEAENASLTEENNKASDDLTQCQG